MFKVVFVLNSYIFEFGEVWYEVVIKWIDVF